MDKLAKQKLVNAVSRMLYGSKPSRLGSAASGAAVGRSFGIALEAILKKKHLGLTGAVAGGTAGGLRGARRLAVYKARRTNVNRGLAGASLAGLGALALKESKSRD
jgi:hypothetical protein